MIQGHEAQRLKQAYARDKTAPWLQWGPYLSERQWGTVREDYSDGGCAWDYFSHEQARSRAYRWGEDGLAGFSDLEQKLCFSLALWNGQDTILKERLFGLTNSEGNHGEDVKEYYYYLDNTPTHSYMKWLYKYPQRAFPYTDLVNENAARKRNDAHAFEYELFDTGVFAENRYFDVQVEYAKVSPQDIVIRIRVTNHGPDTASLQVLPTLWFRNTWSWLINTPRPQLQGKLVQGLGTIQATPIQGDALESMMLYCEQPDELLFVENMTNNVKLWESQNQSDYVKDGINDYIVAKKNTVNPALEGTKSSALYRISVASQETKEIRLRFSANLSNAAPFGADFDDTFAARIAEADEFYQAIAPAGLTHEELTIQRQAYAGMLWSKQYYYYIVADWLNGDPTTPPPSPNRSRNRDWTHFYACDVLSMPDAWEYPWFASWDLCFQSVVFARLDAEFAKNQLRILAHEWYMSPNGAVPAYEWAFGDVNPPLHAWAALRIFEIDKELNGVEDLQFLQDILRHCLIYFTWWANREDSDSKNLFRGGFLGLDNISILDRSHIEDFERQIGRDVELYEADGTIWMGLFSLNILQMALRLVKYGCVEYAPIAGKFFQHFVFIADAFNCSHPDESQISMWDETDGFYYDVLKVKGSRDQYFSIKLRSLVGIIALFPTMTLDLSEIAEESAVELRRKLDWFLEQHPELVGQAIATKTDDQDRILLSFVDQGRLVKILKRVLDESEFLSPHGVRGISQVYRDTPYSLNIEGATLFEQYEPAESSVGLFGGNSNWRGPVWFPINFLLTESLNRYHDFLGDQFTVEYPTHSGQYHTLHDISQALSQRLISIFRRDANGNRPVYGGNTTFQTDPTWCDLLLFFEYFHGDNGAGLGASHQTGWTGLVAELLNRSMKKGT